MLPVSPGPRWDSWGTEPQAGQLGRVPLRIRPCFFRASPTEEGAWACPSLQPPQPPGLTEGAPPFPGRGSPHRSYDGPAPRAHAQRVQPAPGPAAGVRTLRGPRWAQGHGRLRAPTPAPAAAPCKGAVHRGQGRAGTAAYLRQPLRQPVPFGRAPPRGSPTSHAGCSPPCGAAPLPALCGGLAARAPAPGPAAARAQRNTFIYRVGIAPSTVQRGRGAGPTPLALPSERAS